jgi:hypothetical protein
MLWQGSLTPLGMHAFGAQIPEVSIYLSLPDCQSRAAAMTASNTQLLAELPSLLSSAFEGQLQRAMRVPVT